MKSFRHFYLIAMAALLSACAGKQVDLPENYFQTQKNKTVAVVNDAAIKDKVYLTGFQGLLDVAVNKAANSKLEKALSDEDNTKWMAELTKSFTTELNKHHIQTKLVKNDATINSVNKQANKIQLGTDQVLTLKLLLAGGKRNYYGFIPLSNPRAYYQLEGELKDIKANKVIWKKVVEVDVDSGKKWNNYPDFPEVKSAMHVAQKQLSQKIISSFFAKA